MSSKLTLLYVDDEQANILLFKVNFRSSFNLLSASSGREAIELLKNHPEVSTVVSDLRMPGMSGLEFVSEAHKLFPDIRYFILSGIEASDEIKESIAKKILTGYFCKPINISIVSEELCNHANV